LLVFFLCYSIYCSLKTNIIDYLEEEEIENENTRNSIFEKIPKSSLFVTCNTHLQEFYSKRVEDIINNFPS